MKQFNTTQLNPKECFEKHIFHRDQFAHYLRWTHVLKLAKIGMNILDFGCGTGNLAEVLYRNKYKANKYLGLEYRKNVVENNKIKFKNIPWIEFKHCDLTDTFINYGNNWDIIVCFEVIEHINKINIEPFLNNLKNHCNKNTIVLLSTPVYDEIIGAANNHIINNIIQEFKFNELKQYLEKYFIIEDIFGTFASQKDYKKYMNDWQLKMFEHLTKYYDSNLVSNFMAPFFPDKSRNCLWRLKIKNEFT